MSTERMMTLDEYVAVLPESHVARVELTRLRTALAAAERAGAERQRRLDGDWMRENGYTEAADMLALSGPPPPARRWGVGEIAGQCGHGRPLDSGCPDCLCDDIERQERDLATRDAAPLFEATQWNEDDNDDTP